MLKSHYSGALEREESARSGAPWVRKCGNLTHPRKSGNHMTIHRPRDRVRRHHRHTNVVT